VSHNRRVSVIGLGYVGLPVAVAFGRKGDPVVAFDIDEGRIKELIGGHDRTGEIDGPDLKDANLVYSCEPKDLREADFHIVAVPTPIDDTNRPNLRPVLSAAKTVGGQLKKGDIVVFESTVYPGVTEEECVPVLEAESGLTCGPDFTVGYSPERINPGDKVHRFETITKVVSGQDAETLDVVADVYASVVDTGVHRAPSIKAAEAAKVIENTQRDLNIALMNELALIFDRLGIDTHDVLEAAGTKWNFLPFSPGLVGGHCIGVDPYYLTFRAEAVGYNPQVILAGRRINDGMGGWIAGETVKRLLKSGNGGRRGVTILGVTFKEDVPDCRNTKVTDIAHELESYGLNVQVSDPVADPDEVKHEYGLTLTAHEDLQPADAVIVAVPHRQYLEGGWPMISQLLHEEQGFVVDVRSSMDRTGKPEAVKLWRI